MNPLSFLPLLMVALLQGSIASTVPRSLRTVVPRADCEPSDFIECIVNLAELPMQITTCLEAINDLNDLFNNIDSSDDVADDNFKMTVQGADCIAEAFLAGTELPEHCGGCSKALDGECPNAEVPCTGPPPPSNELR